MILRAVSVLLLCVAIVAYAASTIPSSKIKQLRPGMTESEVRELLGEPEMIVSGTAPGPIYQYNFIFNDFEAISIYGETYALVSFDRDHKFIALASPPEVPVSAGAGLGIPNGRSAGIEPFARLDAYSIDPGWGFSRERPIRVAGLYPQSGPRSEKAFLSALRGPKGEILSYERKGSCCRFSAQNGNEGMLDIFEITRLGRAEPIVLYLNMYDPGPREVPAGFTFRLPSFPMRNLPQSGAETRAKTAPSTDSAASQPQR